MLRTEWLGCKSKIHIILVDREPLFVCVYMYYGIWSFGEHNKLHAYQIGYKCFLGASLIREKGKV